MPVTESEQRAWSRSRLRFAGSGREDVTSYPLLPILNNEGRLIGAEPLGIYEELERIAGLEPACKLTSLPFDQLNKLLLIAQEIGTHPRLQFYLAAYRIAKRHVITRLEERFNASGNVFSSFETGFIRRRPMDYHTEWRGLVISLRTYGRLILRVIGNQTSSIEPRRFISLSRLRISDQYIVTSNDMSRAG